jgi:ATP:corrinoid adenosyltransferase
MPEDKRKALVVVYTGDSKGKTTAAAEHAVQAWGRGLR